MQDTDNERCQRTYHKQIAEADTRHASVGEEEREESNGRATAAHPMRKRRTRSMERVRPRKREEQP